MKNNWQTILLVGSMIFGFLFPQFHTLSFLVRYILIIMIFIAFIEIKIDHTIVDRSSLFLLLAAPALAVVSYFLIIPFDRDCALAAFFICLTPTATASPVMVGLIGGNPSYPAFMVIISSVTQPLLMALTISCLSGASILGGFGDFIIPILSTIMFPCIAARLSVRLFPSLTSRIKPFRSLSFILWILIIIIVIAGASDFIRKAEGSAVKAAVIAIISFMLCILQFSLGRKIGGKRFRIEAGQSLGHKNTVFTIWVTMSFISPIVALGPAFYIIWHNLWNAWQIHRYQHSK